MNKIREQLAFHKTGRRLLRIAHSIDASMIPLWLLNTILQISATFLSLLFTSELIDSLLQKDFHLAFIWAMLVISVNLFAEVIGCILHTTTYRISIKCSRTFTVMLREKALSLDYETMENPKIREQILFAERTASLYGGLGRIVQRYQELLQNLLGILCSLALIISFCLKTGTQGPRILIALNHPVISTFLLAALMIGNSLLTLNTAQKYDNWIKSIYQIHTKVENQISYLVNNIFCNYKAGKVIRIFQMQDMLLKNGAHVEGKNLQFFEQYSQLEVHKEGSILIYNSVFTLTAYLMVIIKVLTGAISVGTFTKYVGALNQFGSCYGELLSLHKNLERLCSYMQEFLDFLDLESPHETGTIPVEKRLDNEFELCFEDVSFHYPGSEEMILKHVNCKLTMKNKMAVVGRNGAGKTTFIKLLCRLYDPTEGRITLNGVDIRKYDEQEYRDLFGVVFQDFKLFSFPVRENLVAGYDAEDARLWQCLEEAGAAETVRNMPHGLNTVLYKNTNDGVEISGGEAQKLALARALYKDAPFVILDEPTAALDPVSEAKVYAGFDKMVKDKTSIYISHRMSSCRFCDDIIVFDHGEIAERGRHEELLASGGKYAAMWNAQAKYYEVT